MKLSRIVYFILIFAVFLQGCNTDSYNASVEANIINLGNDTIFISLTPYNKDQSYHFDTLTCYNGKFHFDTLINELNHGFIISKSMYNKLDNGQSYFIRSKTIEFFLNPKEELRIKGTSLEYKTDYKLYGSELNNQLNNFQEIVSDDYARIIELDMQVENHFINNSSDSIIDNLMQKQHKLYTRKLEAEISFLKTNPTYELSAFLLNKQSKDTIIKYYPTLSDNVKEFEYGRLIKKQLSVWEKFKVGSEAPDFEYLTVNKDTFKFRNQLGKIVILDFWGTWCKSCIKGIPKMKEYYSKYKEETVFVSIACRDNKLDLIKAIDKYKLPWLQILNETDNELDILSKYAIEGFPTKIIVNKEGIIEGIFLGETNEFYDKLDQILKE